MYTIGFDVGSSSVKAAVLDAESGEIVASAYAPKTEMPITAVHPGWAEQDPAMWWKELKEASAEAIAASGIQGDMIAAVGISYQMHGLVLVDKSLNVLRPSIIWCDSRAVEIGNRAFAAIGADRCLSHLLNSPGNFTASKLRWVRENEPHVFARVHKFMLPGDYIALRLTGEAATTASGLSEGMMWDFTSDAPASFLLEHYQIVPETVPPVVPTFAIQGTLTYSASQELGFRSGIPVSYRAGDQPNNALSLNVLEPGEVAATAGTSGVVYGVSGAARYDPKSRVNSFAHVSHSKAQCRIGILLCINGCGIANRWIRQIAGSGGGYEALNDRASSAPIGADGVVVLPFGNGAERMLENRTIGAGFLNVNYNLHDDAHLVRAVQEGVAFSFAYGMEIMKTVGLDLSVIRAGRANMFLSPVFTRTLAGVTGVTIELYNTDGAQGAARGAAIGGGVAASFGEAFRGVMRVAVVEPDAQLCSAFAGAYGRWKDALALFLNK